MEIIGSRSLESEPLPNSISGWLCLAFCNTVENYRLDEPLDALRSYRDLVEWSIRAQTIGPEIAADVNAEASRRPDHAEKVLKEAKSFRAAIYRIFSALAHGREPLQDDLDRLNEGLRGGLARLVVAVTPGGYSWAWSSADPDLAACVWPVAQSAAALLTSPDLQRLRQCGGRGCTWLFLDRSKNKSRRWCDMGICGNRAKSRRHYARQKSGGGEG